RTRLFVARKQFGKRHHQPRRPDRLEALRCSVETDRRAASQGRQHGRYRLKTSPSQQAPVQRQRGAGLSYASLATWDSPCLVRDRISDVPVQHEFYFPHLDAFVSCGLSQNETIFKLTAKKERRVLIETARFWRVSVRAPT